MRSGVPPEEPKHPSHGERRAAWLQDMPPAQPHGGHSCDRTVDVAIEIVPAIELSLMPETAVELDDQPEGDVLDVSVGGGASHAYSALPLGGGQPVRTLDPHQLPVLENRVRP